MNEYERIYNQANEFLTQNNVNVFKIMEWKNLLGNSNFDITEYEKLLLYFNVSVFREGTTFASVNPPNILKIVEEQVYLFLKEKENHGKAELLITGLISEICVEISKHIDINAFIVAGILDLLLLGIMKIGINTWCKYYEEKIRNDNENK